MDDLEIANGTMAPGHQKEMLAEKMTLFTEIEKTKKQILSLSVEKEKLKAELKASRNKETALSNSVQSMQLKLDAAHLANAAVRTAVLSAEILKLNATVSQLKEQAHISSTEKSGLVFELESMKDEVSDAERKNRQINDLIEGKIQVYSELQKSKDACLTSKLKIDTLQVTIQDLHEKISRKDEEITVCQSVAFVNTKKSESDKALMQLKLQSSNSKLDAMSNRLEMVIVENSALEYDRSAMQLKVLTSNTRIESLIAENKEREEQIAADHEVIISTLTKQLNDLKCKEIDNDSITLKLQSDLNNSKMDLQRKGVKSDEKDNEIKLYNLQMKKTILIINNLNKEVKDLELKYLSKHEHFTKKLKNTNNNFLIVEMNLLDLKTVLSIEKRRNLELIKNNENLISEHELQLNKWTESETAFLLNEKLYKNQKSELFKIKIDLEKKKEIIDKQTLDYESEIKAKNNDFKFYLKELDPLKAQVLAMKSEKDKIAQLHNEKILEIRRNFEAAERALSEKLVHSNDAAELSRDKNKEKLDILNNTVKLLQTESNSSTIQHAVIVSNMTRDIDDVKKELIKSEKRAEFILNEQDKSKIVYDQNIDEINKKLLASQSNILIVTERETSQRVEIDTLKSDVTLSQKKIESLQHDLAVTQRVSDIRIFKMFFISLYEFSI